MSLQGVTAPKYIRKDFYMPKKEITTCSYMYGLNASLSRLNQTIQEAFLPIIETRYSTLYDSLDGLKECCQQLLMILDEINTQRLSDATFHLTNVLAECLQAIEPSYLEIDFDISDDKSTVELTETSLNSVSEFLNANSHTQISPKSRMALKEFIKDILIPIICLIIPMMQNSYYHRLDNEDSAKQQTVEQSYSQQEIEALKEINETLNALLTQLESPQDNQELSDESPESLPHSSVSANTSVEVPDNSCDCND